MIWLVVLVRRNLAPVLRNGVEVTSDGGLGDHGGERRNRQNDKGGYSHVDGHALGA